MNQLISIDKFHLPMDKFLSILDRHINKNRFAAISHDGIIRYQVIVDVPPIENKLLYERERMIFKEKNQHNKLERINAAISESTNEIELEYLLKQKALTELRISKL